MSCDLESRIMYGSDFSINLLDSNGYAEYLGKFLDGENPAYEQKHKMCSVNPAKFLWG